MATRAQKAKVGLFMIICSALIVVGLFLVSGRKLEERRPYWMEFEESVLGLSDGAIVEYLGVPVGYVENIYVTPEGRPHVDIMVSTEKVQLHQGVTGKTVMFSLATGILYISLRGGDPRLPVLPPNSQITAEPSFVSALGSRAEVIFEDFSEVIGKVRAGLEGMEEGELHDIVEDVKGILADAHEFLDETTKAVQSVKEQVDTGVGKFNELVENMQEVAASIKETSDTIREKVASIKVGDAKQKLEDVLDSVNELAGHLGETIKTLDTVSRSALHEVDNVEYGLREALRTATETLESIRTLAESLEEDPGQLLRGKGKPTGGD